MTIIIPNELRNISTNLPLNDYELYNENETYSTGDKVSFENKNYLCTKDNIVNKNPKEYDGSLWLGTPTNAYNLFEAKANAKTKFSDTLRVEFDISYADKIALFGVKASSIQINISSPSWGSKTIEEDLKIDVINDFSDYLYGQFSYKSTLEYDFPLLYSGHIVIELESSNLKGEVGFLLAGKSEYLGECLYGGKIGLTSFTQKQRNIWGDMEIKAGNTYGKLDLPILIQEHEMDRVYNILKKVDAKPCVFTANSSKRKENLRVLGVYRDLEIPILSSSITYNLRIESII